MYLINGTLYSTDSRLLLLPLASEEKSLVYARQEPMPVSSSPLEEDHVLWHGILAVLLGAACFGTMHVPIRKYHKGGDGFFVQWVMSMGILTVGFMVNAVEMSPPIRIYAVLGGMLWTIANSLSQYVISGLGLAVGLVLWNTTNCLTGWLSGRFGLFGLKAVVPTHEFLNVVGLVVLLMGGLLFAFVRKTRPLPGTPTEHSDVENTSSASDRKLSFKRKSKSMPLLHVPDPSTVEKIALSLKQGVSSNSKRIICIVLALLSGFFYGATTIPVIYMEDHPEEYPSSSRSGIPYIFSHYFGIFIGSSIIFVVYALFRKNKPVVNPAVILPSMLGGMIWGVGMVTLFMSNDILTQTVTYPVMTTLPGCIASLWSVFYFKEINSKRNYAIICFAFLIIITGAVFVFLSKIDF